MNVITTRASRCSILFMSVAVIILCAGNAPSAAQSHKLQVSDGDKDLLADRAVVALRWQPPLWEVAVRGRFNGKGDASFELPEGTYVIEAFTQQSDNRLFAERPKDKDLIAVRSQKVSLDSSATVKLELKRLRIFDHVLTAKDKPRLNEIRLMSLAPKSDYRADWSESEARDFSVIVNTQSSIDFIVWAKGSKGPILVWSNTKALRQGKLLLNPSRLRQVVPSVQTSRQLGEVDANVSLYSFGNRFNVGKIADGNRRIATNRRFLMLGYELVDANGRKLVFRQTPLNVKRRTQVRLGYQIEMKAWGMVVDHTTASSPKRFVYGAELVDHAGRVVNRQRSSAPIEISLSPSRAKDMAERNLTKREAKLLPSSISDVTAEMTVEFGKDELEYENDLDGPKSARFRHFRMDAPEALANHAAFYLGQLESRHAALREITGKRGPGAISVRWRAKTGGARGQVGGSESWIRMPLPQLRRSVSFYTHVPMLTHELAHNFGYSHGEKMKQAIGAANDRLEAERRAARTDPDWRPPF